MRILSQAELYYGISYRMGWFAEVNCIYVKAMNECTFGNFFANFVPNKSGFKLKVHQIRKQLASILNQYRHFDLVRVVGKVREPDPDHREVLGIH